HDVSFCPYTSVDPVFAVTGGTATVVCRCVLDAETSIEILRWFEDDEERKPDDPLVLNSLAWSQAKNGDPLLCVGGNTPHIKVLNVTTGELVTTLNGHGDHVNDLVVSPIDPDLVASASFDCSVRIWSLDPDHRRQPLAAQCHGLGHNEGLLALCWHRKGRYLLSGGLSPTVNLWMIPESVKHHAGTDKQAMIHVPYFSSSEIHKEFVDCVRFFNDLVISHAAREDRIVIWRIDGFSSDAPPPDSAAVPVSQAVNTSTRVTFPTWSTTGTRSAWGGRFQLLMQLYLPDTVGFYIRFGLLHEMYMAPILAAGNEKSKMYFWNLQHLEEEAQQPPPANKAIPLPHNFREEAESSASSHSTINVATGSTNKTPQAKPKNITRDLQSPFKSIEAHKVIEYSRATFAFRQMAWSRDGKWCVGVGDLAQIQICYREDTGYAPPPPPPRPKLPTAPITMDIADRSTGAPPPASATHAA
ncbi:WD40 repeat-like protein, partial [Corynespora cassiicola Philippines]